MPIAKDAIAQLCAFGGCCSELAAVLDQVPLSSWNLVGALLVQMLQNLSTMGTSEDD